jgi:hypothetical protein
MKREKSERGDDRGEGEKIIYKHRAKVRKLLSEGEQDWRGSLRERAESRAERKRGSTKTKTNKNKKQNRRNKPMLIHFTQSLVVN